MRLLFLSLMLSASLVANPFWKKTTQPVGTQKAVKHKKYKAPKTPRGKKVKTAKHKTKTPKIREKTITPTPAA